MIKRTYSYHGHIQGDNCHTPFSGCVDCKTWFKDSRKVWNYVIKNTALTYKCEIKDVVLINFNIT